MRKQFYAARRPEGVYSVTAAKKGFQRKTKKNVEVEEGDEVVVSFKLTSDTIAPVISDVKITNKAGFSAMITWTTDKLAAGEVKFGAASGNYTNTVKDAEYTKTHSIALTGLKPETTYYYVVGSIDNAENAVQSKELSFTTDKSGGVMIWDMARKEKGPQWTAFPTYMKHREWWRQVSYGNADYAPTGDVILENKYFYICFNAFHQDALHVKNNGSTLWQNIQYECRYPGKIEVGGVKEYLGGDKSVGIVKNAPDEIIVEHRGTAPSGKNPMVFAYRMLKDKPWVQIKAVKPEKEGTYWGSTAKVRMGLAVVEGGNDYVVDSLRDPVGCYVPVWQA